MVGGSTQALNREFWPRGRVLVGQRQHSILKLKVPVKQMPEPLSLEAEPWAAVPRSCPDTQPSAQRPTLARELLTQLTSKIAPLPHTPGLFQSAKCGATGQEAPLCRVRLTLPGLLPTPTASYPARA